MKQFICCLVTGVLLLGVSALAQANTMTNFSGEGVFSTYVEDGIIMTNNLGNGAWDAYLGWGGVHLDDGKVTVAMANGSSFDLTTVMFGYNSAPVNFLFSNGNTLTQAAGGGATTIDFASLGIANDLDWFSIDGNLPWCTQLASIEMYESAPVPEPGTVFLLGAGFLGLAVYGKRRKKA